MTNSFPFPYRPPTPNNSQDKQRATLLTICGFLSAFLILSVSAVLGYVLQPHLRPVHLGKKISSISHHKKANNTAEIQQNQSKNDDVPPPLGIQSQVAKALPTSVLIQADTDRGFATGSGTIIKDTGFIVTNDHVIDHARTIRITFYDFKQTYAHVVATDPYTDVAVIKADEIGNHGPATVGDSEKLGLGDPVFAIGNPEGVFPFNVSAGVLSGYDRPAFGFPALQTDATINPGNSGGGLYNSKAELIGINESIKTTPGIGEHFVGIAYSIPTAFAQKIWDPMIKNGQVSHGKIGIVFPASRYSSKEQVEKELEEYKGATVYIDSHGPLGKSNLSGTITITNINGHRVTNQFALNSFTNFIMPGESVDIEYSQYGKAHQQKTVTAVPGIDAIPRP